MKKIIVTFSKTTFRFFFICLSLFFIFTFTWIHIHLTPWYLLLSVAVLMQFLCVHDGWNKTWCLLNELFSRPPKHTCCCFSSLVNIHCGFVWNHCVIRAYSNSCLCVTEVFWLKKKNNLGWIAVVGWLVLVNIRDWEI